MDRSYYVTRILDATETTKDQLLSIAYMTDNEIEAVYYKLYKIE